jgi:alkylation response protein AidB-like acyl-CoA dehydrogenase
MSEKALKLRNIDLSVPGYSQIAMKIKSVGLSYNDEKMIHPNIIPDTSSTSDPVTAAQAFTQLVEDNREALAAGPDLSPVLADALIQAGFMQLWMPRALGGPETEPLDFVRVIEALAKLDGAVAWCAMISSLTSRMSGLIAVEPMRRLMSFGKIHAFSGSAHPTGTITRDGDDWRIDGRWTLISFSRHSTVTALMCIEQANGAPHLDVNGRPVVRAAVLPSAMVQVLGNWKGDGLRSSGSHDIICTDVLVPDNCTTTMDMPGRQLSPLYGLSISSAAAISIIGLPLGIAAASIDALVALAQTKIPFFSATPLREQEQVQLEVAWAKTGLLAARAFAFETVGALWAAVCAGRPAVEEQALLRMACCNAGIVGKEVVGRMYAAAGSTALPEEAIFAAQLRDIHAACQHINFANRLMIPPGRVLLGLEAGTPMF